MSSSNSAVSRIVDRVFPRMHDFYGSLNDQCELASRAMDVFVELMRTGDATAAQQVREMEKQGDVLKQRNLDVLNKAFATPMDREDIYRAITSIDHVINYAKTTVRELEALGLEPDRHMLALAEVLRNGANALRDGYGKLSSDPASAEADAQAVRKAERTAEKAYRNALAELFREETLTQQSVSEQGNGESLRHAMACIIGIFKRRELYRHMSNAADRLARAGEVLHDIVVKIS